MRFVPFASQADLLDPGVFVREVSRLSAFAKKCILRPPLLRRSNALTGKGHPAEVGPASASVFAEIVATGIPFAFVSVV